MKYISKAGEKPMIVSVAGGKDGTGKTTVALMLALGATVAQLVDCDAEEPNCHLFINPSTCETYPVEVLTPLIDRQLCNGCGACVKVCRFSAIAVAGETAMNFPDLCHGCGGCILVCKRKAISEIPRQVGEVITGTGSGDFGHVRLISGYLSSGNFALVPVIQKVKQELNECDYTVIDCPSGTSCSMATAVAGSDVCLLVIEPNVFGVHDLELALQALDKMRYKRRGIVINKGENGEWQYQLRKISYQYEVPVLAQIPYCREWGNLYAEGIMPPAATVIGRCLWEEVRLTWPQR